MKQKAKIKAIISLLLAVILTAGANPAVLGEGGQTAAGDDSAIMTEYTVQQGDCLWNLAKEFKVDMELLAAVNGLDPKVILQEGENLIIPDGKTFSYTVRAGDTLYSIAARFGTTLEELVQRNGLAESAFLLEGQELNIPNPQKLAAAWAAVAQRIPRYNSWPVDGIVSSKYGRRNGRMHEGLDIAAEEGEIIRALDAGRVVFAGDRGTYGQAVIINHGQGIRSLYAHASRVLVSPGEYVKEGQAIARVGSTGNSTGPHLHLEVLYKGQPLDPERYLPGAEN